MKIFLIGLVLSLLLLCSCGKKETAPGGSGFIEATEVTISAQTGGQILRRNFDEGQNIAMGDTIAVIDTVRVMLSLRQAEALANAAQTRLESSALAIKQASYNFDLAKKEFDRMETLITSGSANQQQYDQAKNAYDKSVLAKEQAQSAQKTAMADLENANAQIAILQKQYNDCFPVSPVSGIVVTKFIEPGELVAAGRPLVKIANLDTVSVKIYLPPSDLTRIKLGSQASVNPENGSAPVYGNVAWISPEAEFTPKNVQTKEARADLVYAVKIIIPNGNRTLKIGMPVSVSM